MRSLRSRSFERKQKAKRLFDILFFSKIKRKKVLLGVVLFGSVSAVSVFYEYEYLESQLISKLIEASDNITKTTGLNVREVTVEGRLKTKKSALLQALQVSEGDNILAINMTEMKDRINKLPWIKSARIERHLPNKISLTLFERTPMARWQTNKMLKLIDIHGDVIPRVDVSRFLNLPIIIGKNAPNIAGQILKTLSNEPHLFRRIKSLTLVSDRRWDVQLDNQINVHLPEKNPGKAWAHLATVEQGHNIFGDQIQGIDMRLENQLIIKIEKNKTIPGKVRGRNT
ncbi:MAG: FtsQ-type POTRA domain-containing protein [Pseudomonadota bacterium]|nr:FtsQ-type POTRA domain-containing protein [Pseudomonadota bacterium]